MKKRIVSLLALALALIVAGIYSAPRAQVTADQVTLTTVSVGPKARGVGVQQIGEVSTLSAAVATATRTQVIAAPASGSIYLRGLWIEKSTSGSGSVTLSYGTGANCATGTTTLLSLAAATGQTLAFGYYPIGVQVPAGNALCAQTDAATTSVRVLGQ